MFGKFTAWIKSFSNAIKIASNQVKHQSAYEIIKSFCCPEKGQHMFDIKLSGKSQSYRYSAEEIVLDDNFIMSFNPHDIRTITYFAICDRYEAILREHKIKKSYEIVRSESRNGSKFVQLRHKNTKEAYVISLSNFMDVDLIDNLESHDAYHLGFLADKSKLGAIVFV